MIKKKKIRKTLLVVECKEFSSFTNVGKATGSRSMAEGSIKNNAFFSLKIMNIGTPSPARQKVNIPYNFSLEQKVPKEIFFTRNVSKQF